MSFLRNFKNNKLLTWDYLAEVTGVHVMPVFMGFFFFFLLFIKKRIYAPKFLWFFVILLCHGIIMSRFTGYNLDKCFQQVILLFLVLYGSIQIYNYSKRSALQWFVIYFNMALLLSILGIFQFVISIVFHYNIFPYTLDLYPITPAERLHSIFIEPGSIAAFLTPAFSVVILCSNFFNKKKWKSIIILLATILTFSTTAYFMLVIVFIIRFYNFFKKISILFFIFLGIAITYVSSYKYNSDTSSDNTAKEISDMLMKFSDTYNAFSSELTPYDFEMLNLSSYATMTNYWVANHAPYRIIGTGIGTHQQNYEALYKSNFEMYGLNKEEGYSLFNRLFSEFGFLGLFIYFLFLYKMFNKNNIVSISLLLFIIGYLIRGGHYSLYCTALFHVLYYMNKKENISSQQLLNSL